jgi:hypothetical protein
MLKPIIEEQYTAARAYFLAIIALLFIETLLQLPAFLFGLRKPGNFILHLKPTILIRFPL